MGKLADCLFWGADGRGRYGVLVDRHGDDGIGIGVVGRRETGTGKPIPVGPAAALSIADATKVRDRLSKLIEEAR